MPQIAGSLSGESSSGWDVGQVTRVTVKGGRLYVDVLTKSQRFNLVPVMELGGGSLRFAHAPIAGDQGDDAPIFDAAADTDPSGVASAQVVILMNDDGAVYVIGAVAHGSRGLVAETPETEAGEDRPKGIGVADFATVNGGGRFVVDAKGVIEVKPAEGSPFQVNLSGEGNARVRIGRDGEAGETLLLGNATLDYLADLETQIARLEARLAAIESEAQSVGTYLRSGPPVANSKVTPLAAPPLVVLDAAETATSDARLISDVVEISADAKD